MTPAPAGAPLVVAADLGGTKCHAVLAEASGAVLEEDRRPTGELPEPAEVLLASIDRLCRAAGERGRDVGAVAVGVPGFVSAERGLVRGAVNLGWTGYELGTVLRRRLTVPVAVENDVNLAALGEAAAGAGRGAGSLVVMALGTGLGGALVLGGHLVRGSHDAAGEFGFLLGGRHQLARPGLMGMESLVGGRAIAARARAEAAADPAATELRAGTADAAAVFAAAARGDAVAGRIVDEVVEHLAMAVVDVCAVVDPERVVLDGTVGRALAPRIPQLAGLVAASLPHPPGIAVSELAPSAALAGGIAEARRLLGGGPAGS